VTVSCYCACAFKHALYATTALSCCFSNRSVAKVSFKMFSHLSGMLMLQKRQRATMFLFCYRPDFSENRDL